MEGFDIREPWEEGSLFMKEKEYEELTEEYGGWPVADCLIASCNIADAAINKMIRG